MCCSRPGGSSEVPAFRGSHWNLITVYVLVCCAPPPPHCQLTGLLLHFGQILMSMLELSLCCVAFKAGPAAHRVLHSHLLPLSLSSYPGHCVLSTHQSHSDPGAFTLTIISSIRDTLPPHVHKVPFLFSFKILPKCRLLREAFPDHSFFSLAHIPI